MKCMPHSTCFQDVLCHYASEHSNTGGTGTRGSTSGFPRVNYTQELPLALDEMQNDPKKENLKIGKTFEKTISPDGYMYKYIKPVRLLSH